MVVALNLASGQRIGAFRARRMTGRFARSDNSSTRRASGGSRGLGPVVSSADRHAPQSGSAAAGPPRDLSWVIGLLVPVVILLGPGRLVDPSRRRGPPWRPCGPGRVGVWLLAKYVFAPLDRPVRRPGHRAEDRGALAGAERSAGEHRAVPPHGAGRRTLRLARPCGRRRSGRRSRRRRRSISARSSSSSPCSARWRIGGGTARRRR